MAFLRPLLVCALVITCIIQSTNAYKARLTLLHFNDINSQLRPFTDGNPSAPGEWGGLPSLIGLLKAEETGKENVFRIAAGNLIGGESGWLSLVGWEGFGDLVGRFYQPEVMGLGFKEFEAGLAHTNTYLDQWNKTDKTVLVSNAKCTPLPSGNNEKKFCGAIKSNHKIALNSTGNLPLNVGIVGFVNPLVEKLADPDTLTFEQDVPAALKTAMEADDLKGIKTFIAVGSGSVALAMDILSKNSKIKIVVLSGYSSNSKPIEYPVKYGEGFIVKADQFGKTFGRLVVDVDSDSGKVELVSSESKLIDNKGGKDDPAGTAVGVMETNYINKAKDNKIGQTLVKLEGTRDKCWRQECNLGNLVADAMVHCALRNDLLLHPELADTIGIWTSGSIFDDAVQAGDRVTEFDVHKFLPYHNRAHLIKVSGETLKEIFKTSGGAIKAPANNNKNWGQFLQVSSGIEVKYSTDGELKSLRVHHLNNSQPMLDDVDDKTPYDIVVPSFMSRGRSVYDYIPGKLQDVWGKKFLDIGFDDECLYNYTSGLHVLSVGFEQRITISDDDHGGDCKKCSGGNTGLTVFLTLLIFLLIVGLIYVGYRFVWPRISNRPHTSHFP